jgi:hypothetical protein
MLHVSKSFRKFLNDSDNRVAYFLMRAIYYQGWDYKAHRLMIRTDEVNYLTLRDDGTISYLPKGKEHKLTDDGRWARDGRQNGTAGKIIKKIMTPRAVKLFKEAEFTNFVNQYKAACDAECKEFAIHPNIDIPNIYCMNREEGHAGLNDSCMNGDEEYLEIYTKCPHVRILTMMNKEGRLAGRALLWNTEDGVLMDRVYVAKEHYYDMFVEYAETNGFIRKVEYKSYRDKDRYVKDGNVFRKAYKIQTPTDFCYYPYIDTFSYGGDGFLCNAHDFSDIQYEYSSTSGNREGDDYEECARSNRRYHEDELRYIEYGDYAGEHIHQDYAVYCQTDSSYYYEGSDLIVYLESRGNYYRSDDDDIVEINGDYYHTNYDEVRFVDSTGEWHLDEDVVWCDHKDAYLLLEDAVRTPDGDIFHKDDIESLG